MIPQIQLETLKPLHDQTIRERMVKSKRTPSFRKQKLTKRARQWAFFDSIKGYKGPAGIKSFGNIPMEERKK